MSEAQLVLVPLTHAELKKELCYAQPKIQSYGQS